ncbi:hypothetical protein [Bradyrhizobium vignae]|uniref:hypothetical protein n=1 Tax=Bradyrhizobium vignae TaxID=1549949 RepID=UPI00100A655E|nr:hypothetical protein [Bradyrhizobium vignae]RXG83571.1 hypothetical protein EAV90_39000 [Bradyrhizobium vignae]
MATPSPAKVRIWSSRQAMTTERLRAANRANAQRSTGPRSPTGKARASYNAHRHGLAAQAQLDSSQLERAEQLACALMEAISRAGVANAQNEAKFAEAIQCSSAHCGP